MAFPTFDGDQIATDGDSILSGRSTPFVILYPRTIGGIIQESGVVEKNLDLRAYLIPPKGTTRKEIENFQTELNERIGVKNQKNLIIHENVYPNCDVEAIEYDKDIVSNFIRYNIRFKIGDQNTDGSIRQIDTPGLSDFSRGRRLSFKSRIDDFSFRTFDFWHNQDTFRNFDTEITVKYTDSFGGGSRIIKVGGFERFVCECWILGQDEPNANRKNVEAHFFNMINGPLGRLGSLFVQGTELKNVFFESVVMQAPSGVGQRYSMTFLKSLAC